MKMLFLGYIRPIFRLVMVSGIIYHAFQLNRTIYHLVNQVVKNENVVSRVRSTHLSIRNGLRNHLPRISAQPDHLPPG